MQIENNSQDLTIGQILCYELQGNVTLGTIEDFKKNKLVIKNDKGKIQELPASRTYLLPKFKKLNSHTELSEIHLNALEKCKEVALEDIWEIVSIENKEYKVSELCELFFSNNDFLNHLSIYYALISDEIYFKRKANNFKARTIEVVEELKKKKKAEEEKLKSVSSFTEFFIEVNKDSKLKLPKECDFIKDLFIRIVANSQEVSNQDKKFTNNIINEIKNLNLLSENRSLEKHSLEILKRAYLISKDFNFGLVEFGINENHSELENELANEVIKSKVFKDDYQDLTELHCITIDGINTKDMDDALSLEKTKDGYKLGIHVTDIASYIGLNSKFDDTLRKRATSIYFFDKNIDMFPSKLSHNFLSLTKNDNRRVLSYILELNNNFEIKTFKLQPSIINVKEKLSYKEVDNSLENGEDTYLDLYQISSHFESERFKSGGMHIHRREIEIRESETGEIYLEEIFERSPARQLVSEMMIKANELTAKFCFENEIPIFYRTQPKPERTPDLGDLPDGPAREYLKRSVLKPSNTTTKPGLHATLGLDYYTQATSPIRRYSDILIQRQILNFLSGKPLSTSKELLAIMSEADPALRKAKQVSNYRKRYWLLRYLEQKQLKNENINAVVLRNDMKKALVELDEVFMTTLIDVGKVNIGDELTLKIQHVDPVFNELKLG